MPFQKGHIGWNKGTKGIYKPNSGSFKKGCKGYWKGKTGKNHPQWKGGKIKDSHGYIFIHKLIHPFANNKGYVREQRLVVEKYLKRYLTKKEVIHHINKIRDDNRIENLMVFKNGRYHFWFHKKGFCNPISIIFDGRKIR